VSDRAPLGYLAFYFAGGFLAMMTQTMMTLLFGSAPDAQVPDLGASGRHRRGVGRLLRALPRLAHNHVRALVPGADPAWFFLGACFLYQLIEANFGMSGAEAYVVVAFFAHVGGFVFGIIFAIVLARAGRIAPQGGTAVLRLPTERQDREAIAGTAAQGER
jgi:rhomboid family protein